MVDGDSVESILEETGVGDEGLLEEVALVVLGLGGEVLEVLGFLGLMGRGGDGLQWSP